MGKWLFLLVLTCATFAQSASNWGQEILLGTTFTSTDSSRLTTGSIRDTVLADTLYSGILTTKENSEGIYNLVVGLTNVGGGSDSIRVDMRLVTKIRNPSDSPVATTTYFGTWKNLGSVMAATSSPVNFSLAQSDSSWWVANSGRQYRVFDTSVSTDTTIIQATDFVR